MGVFSFLTPPKKGSASNQISELEASLAKLREERKGVEAVVDSYGQRRADALLSDATDADIAKIDSDANLAQIRMERLELAEMELVERIAMAGDSDQRTRRAAELDAAADAIEERAVYLEKAVEALAEAFTAFVEVVPEKSPATKYESASGARPANNLEVARAVLAQGLFQRLPDAFEVFGRQAIGTEFQIRMSVPYLGRDGHLHGDIPKELAADIRFPLASGAADRIVVTPLRNVASEIRAGRCAVDAKRPAPRKAPIEPALPPLVPAYVLKPLGYTNFRGVLDTVARGDTHLPKPVFDRALALGLAVLPDDPRAAEHKQTSRRRYDAFDSRFHKDSPPAETPVDLNVNIKSLLDVERERLNEHLEAAE